MERCAKRLSSFLKKSRYDALKHKLPPESMLEGLKSTFGAFLGMGFLVGSDLFRDVAAIGEKMQGFARQIQDEELTYEQAQEALFLWFAFDGGWQAYLDQMKKHGVWGRYSRA